MEKYWNIIKESYQGYGRYLWNEITFNYDYKPWWENYFWMLVVISAFFLLLEWVKPWRKDQPKFRKDFWLDFFYMFFNFFLFSLIFYNALSDVVVNAFNDFLGLFGITNLVAIEINDWPRWAQLLSLFVIRDFIHWWVHRLLHRNAFLWEFHKVHHSVEQMGFAAHLRYHWMETIAYRTLEYIPLAMIGFGIDDFFIVHMIALAIGHWNHANLRMNIGPLKYIFNNPQMHIWHHAKNLPKQRRYGVNFGLSLSIWDYIFRTDYIPKDGRDIKLGFPGSEKFPKTFWGQIFHGLRKKSIKE
ncbi:MAG: sterol desaturase family protein [Fulvivirga sp.]|nr:sterol desaturase family protein [Fulvivirga sp.]